MGKKKSKKIRVHDELQALKGRIREKKTSYRELSKMTGISVDALNNKINGYTAMDSSEMNKIANELDISPDEVVKYFFPSMLRNAM